MLKTYRYRIYPNKKQEEQIQKTFGCCRFVYNQTLSYRKEIYETNGKSMSKYDCICYVCKVLKKQYEWLKDVDKWALENSVKNMDTAYQNFFNRKTGFPKFKEKRYTKKSYTTNCDKCGSGEKYNIEIDTIKGMIKIPKVKWVKAKISRIFDGKIKSATISQVPSGKYFVSVLVEEKQEERIKLNKKIGIDLGIKDLVITSDGEKYDNPKIIKIYEKKLAKEQKRLCKKNKGSKNWEKQRIKIARIYEKIHNSRIDNLHKISHKLINENQVIVVEDLNVKEMFQNKKIAKILGDISISKFINMLEYKARWYGRKLIRIGRYYPSSQLCSNCGYQNKEAKDLSIRSWECPKCNHLHNRDYNAANNILWHGIEMLLA